MTRWERMKETFKGREPVSTAKIVSDIRAGTVRAFQPAVRAGERFREAQPEVAERISRTATAGQIRESVQIRRDIDTAKRQIVTSEKNLVVLDKKIALAPVRDGIFTGTDKQFLQHEADVKAYNSNINRINTENKRISTLEGKKFIPKLERSVSSYIPTLADISKKGAQFRVKYPAAASTIYTAFEKAHTRTERVGTQSQRNAMAGYTHGSYSSLQRQPVKTAASFAIGGASVKAIKMAGLVGKAYGAGKWTKRMAKAAQYGLLAYYGKKSIEHIMKAPNSYVAGQRAANIMYTEVLPMAAGIKAVTVAPKVIGKIKTTTKRMALDESARLDYGKIGLKVKYELPKAKIRTDKTYEQFIKEQKISKDILSKTEYNNLRASVSQSMKASRAKEVKIKARIKKIETETQSFHEAVMKPKTTAAKPKTTATKTPKAEEYKARSKVTKLEPVEDVLSKFARKQTRLDKKFENGQIEWNTYIKQSKGIKKQVTDTIKFYEDAIIVVEKLKISPPKTKPRAEPVSKIQAKLTQKQFETQIKELSDLMPSFKRRVVTIPKQVTKPKVKAKQKVKPLTAQKFAQQLTASFAVMQLFKQAQKQEAKLKAKQLPKQKQKIVPLLTPAQEAALTTKQEIAAARKAAVAEKVTPKPPRKVTPKPVRKPAIKVPKLIVPPVGPLPKRKAKKKPIRKDRQIVTYTPIQFKNRVATIASLFG